jgi:hypothetical protein
MTHALRDRSLRIALVLAAAWTGCGGSTPSGGPTTQSSTNAQACQALRSGPFSAVMGRATYTFRDPPPPIPDAGKTYRVSLPTPSNVGHVSFKVPVSGEFVVFTNRTSGIALFTWDGTLINAKTVAGSVSECAEVKTRQSFDLVTDTAAHIIKLGPESGGPVDLLVSPAIP